MGLRRKEKGREDSAAQSRTAADVDVPVAAGAGHTCGSPLMAVCLMARVGAVRLVNGRVGVMTTGEATSVAVTCRACRGCIVVVARYTAFRVLKEMARHWRRRLGHVKGRDLER